MTAPKKSAADQMIETGKAITSVFFSLVFLAFIAFVVYLFWQ